MVGKGFTLSQVEANGILLIFPLVSPGDVRVILKPE